MRRLSSDGDEEWLWHGADPQVGEGVAEVREVWAETAHPEHRQYSVAEMLELEHEHLMSMPEPFDGYVESPALVRRGQPVKVV